MKYGVSGLYGTDEIIHILSDKDLKDESSSLSEKYVRDIEDGKIEFY